MPTDSERKQVEALSGYGLPIEQIAVLVRDGIDTALSLGLDLERLDLEVTPFTLDELHQPQDPQAAQFLAFVNHWTRLTTMLNEMSRSMGQSDFYPFALPAQAEEPLVLLAHVPTERCVALPAYYVRSQLAKLIPSAVDLADELLRSE